MIIVFLYCIRWAPSTNLFNFGREQSCIIAIIWKNALLGVILLSEQPTTRGGLLGKKLYTHYRKWTMRVYKVLSPTVVIGTFLCHEYFGLWFLLYSTLADQTPNWFSLTIPPFSLWFGTWPSLLNHTVFGTWCLNPWVKLGVFGAPIVKETLAKPRNSWAFSEKFTLCQNFLHWLGVLDIWTLLSTV